MSLLLICQSFHKIRQKFLILTKYLSLLRPNQLNQITKNLSLLKQNIILMFNKKTKKLHFFFLVKWSKTITQKNLILKCNFVYCSFTIYHKKIENKWPLTDLFNAGFKLDLDLAEVVDLVFLSLEIFHSFLSEKKIGKNDRVIDFCLQHIWSKIIMSKHLNLSITGHFSAEWTGVIGIKCLTQWHHTVTTSRIKPAASCSQARLLLPLSHSLEFKVIFSKFVQ